MYYAFLNKIKSYIKKLSICLYYIWKQYKKFICDLEPE